MNNFAQIIRSIIKEKENNKCPILSLGYLHALEWQSCFLDNQIDLRQLIQKIDHDLLLPKIRLDFEMQNSIINYNNIINNKLKSFYDESITNNHISTIKNTNLKKVFPLNGSITNKSICFHSVGDPFIQGWTYLGKVNSNIAWVTDNISKLYENNFINVTFGERKLLINNISDIDYIENIFLFFLPSFCLENYDYFKKALNNDISEWPNFTTHIGASTCFTDPVFHLIAEFKKIPNIGVQHGGGPLTIFLDYKTELMAYKDFYFLPPLSKTLHNTRGDMSFKTIFYIETKKLIMYLLNKSFRIFGFYNFFLKSIYRIIYNFYIFIIKYLKSFKKIKPIIIFDRLYYDHNLIILNSINKKYYIKLHPFDDYKDYNLLVNLKKNKTIEMYPIKKKIEFNLWRWRNSYILINSYRSTVLIFLFEGITPFLIVLSENQIKNILKSISDESLIVFNYLLSNDIIITNAKFSILEESSLHYLAIKARDLCREKYSTASKLRQRIKFNLMFTT
jgi:hypothetical protein